MTSFVYQGTAYRQALDQNAPWLVTFVASAEDLLAWAGIPRRTDKDLIGFQRPDDDARVLKAKDYFSRYGMNQSPTSLVLGIHPSVGEGASVELTFQGGSETDTSRPCQLRVSFDPLEPMHTVLRRISSQVKSRLDQEPEIDGIAADGDEIGNEGDEETGIDEAGDDAAAETEEFELGRSLLQDLLNRLGDPAWTASNERDLRDLAKPATVIDGQHRLLGAKLCERRIPFSVIAIHNCTWAEQVFQFTVVNYTAKGIPDQFITANAALSLTAGELGLLERRLQQAGVKVIEYELMRIINFDSDSPFHDLVNLTPKNRDDLIGYKTMVQVGKAWYTGKASAVKQIIDNIYPELKGKGHQKRRMRLERWKQDDWGLFFKDFWNTVREHFTDAPTQSGISLWSVGTSNLMIAAVLQVLQEQFLTNLAAQDESFFVVPDSDPVNEMRAKMRKRASTFISYFESDLFAQHWQMKSLNTGAGRTALREVMRAVVETRGSYQYTKSALFTNKTSPTP
jgi:hypothetical protein